MHGTIDCNEVSCSVGWEEENNQKALAPFLLVPSLHVSFPDQPYTSNKKQLHYENYHRDHINRIEVRTTFVKACNYLRDHNNLHYIFFYYDHD
ncbi:unnamed protein product [Prunus brigantina]